MVYIYLVTLRAPPAILTGSERFLYYISRHLMIDYGYKSLLITSNVMNLESLNNMSIHRYDKERLCSYLNKVNGVNVIRLPLDIGKQKIWRTFSKLVSRMPKNFISEPLIDYIEASGIGPLFYGLDRILKHFPCNLIHVTPLPYSFVIQCIKMALNLRIPIVVTPFYHYKLERMFKNIHFKLLAKADAITACTRYEKEKLIERGIEPEKIHIIPMGIEPSEYKVNEQYAEILKHKLGVNGKFVIITTARNKYKGTYDLVKALTILNRRDVVLIAFGPKDPSWNAFINKIKGKVDIIDLGWIDEKTKNTLFYICDLLALPSIADAFGIAYLEAWYFEKPVIAAKTEAMQEVVKDYEDGLLVEYGNPRDLAEKILILLLWLKLILLI